MTAISTARRISIEEVPSEQRVKMERVACDHLSHRGDLNIEMVRRSGQAMANLKYEIENCSTCGKKVPYVHIDMLAKVLDSMLGKTS